MQQHLTNGERLAGISRMNYLGIITARSADSVQYLTIFRLDALAWSVIATATWLGGWLGGWLSHSGIVSKRLNLSENSFDHLKAPSF